MFGSVEVKETAEYLRGPLKPLICVDPNHFHPTCYSTTLR
jgi:hypothetical protein